MKNKTLLALLTTATLVLSVGCSSSSQETSTKTESKQEVKKETKVWKQEDMQKVITDPNAYKGDTVEYYAKVFIEPERDKKGVYLQAFALNKGADGSTIIAFNDPNFQVKNGDIIYVKGVVTKEFKGENLMGGEVTAPVIEAKELKISDYATAFAPAKKTVEVNQEKEQSGFKVTVKKIEIAAEETRVYVSVENTSNANISVFKHSSKLVQDGKQLELGDDYGKGYAELQTDVLPGATTEGVLVFPAISESGEVHFYLDGSSDNYEVNIEPFQFGVKY